MNKYLLTAFLLLGCTAAFALSSNTNSAPFTWTVEETNLTPNPLHHI